MSQAAPARVGAALLRGTMRTFEGSSGGPKSGAKKKPAKKNGWVYLVGSSSKTS